MHRQTLGHGKYQFHDGERQDQHACTLAYGIQLPQRKKPPRAGIVASNPLTGVAQSPHRPDHHDAAEQIGKQHRSAVDYWNRSFQSQLS
ncbi:MULTISPECIES: hypothetical protein [unclassified Pseudomonas]|uniref:hypothetical protein n=1 Tax=unclassified Pseudomonas TaxID=196821 RepID=UPI002AC9B339|nr:MULTISPECIES: hypothetical protein [unclassified Pseudomonas]MEB0039793.1 hypothetical protein [Pseudomonas sp. MH10]MEB0077265.1 hypothetical protein [Pseudomonas sp. MH10out]MEB0091404.1 hypothetical protein [Pseudomonas sp. CCI4.2]MEB0101612.1 hypothetical protein [Pseudomonas sp. CCI3.2]MEB0120721.1 hypothetical protein [Pseudomonas sp. CCI1.2]